MKAIRSFNRNRKRKALKKRRAALTDHYSWLEELTAADDPKLIKSHSAPMMGIVWEEIRDIDKRLSELNQEV